MARLSLAATTYVPLMLGLSWRCILGIPCMARSVCCVGSPGSSGSELAGRGARECKRGGHVAAPLV